MLYVKDLTYRAGSRVLFDHATVAVNKGECVGLVGQNGTGKTTLLRLLCGELAPDGGEVGIAGRGRVGMVSQEAPSGEESLIDTVLAADLERAALLREAEEAQDPARIAEIHERLAMIRAESAPARAARILSGLGFDEEAQQRPCRAFSGGWRMRVSLAALLFSEPDLLLLDEPTNHLDLEAAIWLESFLKSYGGTILLVSHDRDLLNRVPQKIIHLENAKLTLYNGNYDVFERTRRERLERIAALNAKQQEQRRHIQAFVDRFRYKASKARQAQSRLKMLERLQPIATVVESQTVAFNFPQPEALSPPLINLEDASVGYSADNPVLTGLNQRIDMDDRIALLGANGNGKSTLVKLLAGRLKPLSGALRKSSKLKVGYFAQDQREELDPRASPLTHLERMMPMEPETRLRAQLSRFGFTEQKVETETAKLSGGEKARLLFALMSREAPQILLLDEPTNHLDVDAREALVQALNSYEGAVVLVSHDAHLVELVADRLWLVHEGKVESFDGDMEDYRRLLIEQRRQERSSKRGEKPANPEALDKKERRRQAAAERHAVAHLRKAAAAAERELEKLHESLGELERELADPEVYNGPTAKLMALQVRHGEIKQRIEAAEARWMAAQEEMEQA